MAPTPDELSAPGAVSYDSNTMSVGDGTWDFSKNTFLLPNLQGLNFDTMQYNGEAATAPSGWDRKLDHELTGLLQAWPTGSQLSPNTIASSWPMPSWVP